MPADWASKVPFKLGGLLAKPVWTGPPEEIADAALPANEFQLFLREKEDAIRAWNPALVGEDDRRELLSSAALYWHEELTPEDRADYRTRAAAARDQHAAAEAAREAANPRLKAFRQKMQVRGRAGAQAPCGRG